MLGAKFKKQVSELDVTKRQLGEAVKANDRLSILCSNLKTQLSVAQREVKGQQSMLQALHSDRSAAQRQAHTAQLQLDQQRMTSHKLQLDVNKQLQEATSKQQLFEDRLVTSQRADTRRLEQRVTELEEQLTSERQAHARSKLALDHLRTHFASLPYTDDVTLRSGMVTDDQLQSWER